MANNVNHDKIAPSGSMLFDQEYHIINLYTASIFCPENVVCFLHLLHIFRCISDMILS